MPLPGFAATASLYESPNAYTAVPLSASGVVTPASLPGAPCVAACVAAMIEMRGLGTALGPGDMPIIVQTCAAMCGVVYTPALAQAVMAELLGTAGAGAGLATGAAVAGALLVVAIALGLIYYESRVRPEELPSGPSCGSTSAHLSQRRVKVNAWGCNRSYAQAVEAANAQCAAMSGQCTGECKAGKTCRSQAAVQRWSQATHFGYCGTRIYFTCPCECV